MSEIQEELHGFIGVAQVFAAGLVTIIIEVTRQWARRKMDLWEAEHPVLDAEEDEDE